MVAKFKYVEKENYIAIQIEEGNFEGVVVRYGAVQFSEVQEDGTRGMKFGYEILDNPNELEFTDEFIDTAGEILLQCIEEQLESGEVVYANGKD